MKKFLEYLDYINESADDGKVKHIEHVDDLHINEPSGFSKAVEVLNKAKEHSEGKLSGHQLTTKLDGSPSTVWGHHPVTGKFFVGSKSVFNKEPKINYTEEDIERNHGHAPGLVDALKHALKHLPKITPKKGVFQGDMMHKGGSSEFTPNTLTYRSKGADAVKAKLSKFGIAPHTEYKGDSVESMKSQPISDHSVFKKHADVHNVSPEYRGSDTPWPATHEKKFNDELYKAHKAAAKIDHEVLAPHREHLKTYINQTVRTGETPSHEGYIQHVQNKQDKAVASVKTDKAKQSKIDHFQSLISPEKANHSRISISSALAAAHHISRAKDLVLHHLEKSNTGLEARLDGKKSQHEGYVSTHTGSPVKLVDRHTFSAANFGNKG
jgi:Family of unknown function (DUF6267)